MRRTLKFGGVAVMAVTAIMGGSQVASASSPCEPVRAVIIDAGTTTNCNSPNDFCAAGTVRGNAGLNGTTYYTMDGGVHGPANAPTYIMATGILVYTTRSGTMTVRETGVSNAAPTADSGTTASVEDIISGTGRFKHASGHLFINGNAANGQFVSQVSGQICRS